MSASSSTAPDTLDAAVAAARACVHCGDLPLGPRPVLRASATARILIVGQAPGTRVHATGFPWNDPSGDRLRAWMGVDRETFYDERRIAIVPMGFCYPGTGKSGDLPPRPECAPRWHAKVMAGMPGIALGILCGAYAHRHYLGRHRRPTLTATLRAWAEMPAPFLPLPHPSGRNNGWLVRNPWFEAELVPALRAEVERLLRR